MSYLHHFNYQTFGDESKPKLVFLHGLMGFGNNWKTLSRQLEENYQILLFDQRGHGRSFQPPKGYAASDLSADLFHILKELGWSKISLVGHSMGARVAADFAAQHPEMVEKLVLVDMGPVSELSSMLSTEEKIKFVPVPFASREEARAFFDGPFLEKYKNPVLKQFFYANLDNNENGEMNWRFYLPGILEVLWQSRVGNQWAQFKAFEMPTLLIRGGKSTDLPQELYEKILQENSQIQGEVIEDAGHWVHVEKPQEFMACLKSFLLDERGK